MPERADVTASFLVRADDPNDHLKIELLDKSQKSVPKSVGDFNRSELQTCTSAQGVRTLWKSSASNRHRRGDSPEYNPEYPTTLRDENDESGHVSVHAKGLGDSTS